MSNYKHHIIKERFDLDITQEEGTFKGEFELDKNAKYVKGVLITSDDDLSLYYRGTQKITINDKELFPEGFESKLLMSGINVAPDSRAISVGKIPVGNGKVEIWYKDNLRAGSSFSAYRISLYVFSIVDKSKDKSEDLC